MSPLRSELPALQFDVGDPVLLTYIRGARKVIVPVVVSKVWCLLELDTETSAPMKSTVSSYGVSSGRGGELRVDPSALRPGTVLDRIAVALDEMDDGPHPTAVGPAQLRSSPVEKCGHHTSTGEAKFPGDVSDFSSH